MPIREAGLMRRVHFATLSRSDYATLKPVALAAARDEAFAVKVIAGGSHLLARFGRTLDGILADGHPSVSVVDFLGETDSTDAEMAAAFARAVNGFVRELRADAPDLLFIVGDRWEMLAPATAASLLRIPIAHHSGGDITQGSADNQTRYALTMLAHLHLTALPEHAERLKRMGEEPWRVHTVGEPALTGIRGAAGNGGDLRKFLGLGAAEPFALATFHPTSYDRLPADEQIGIFLEALDEVGEAIVLTAPNPDPGSGRFYARISEFAQTHPRVRLSESLGSRYYPAMAEAAFMIGNSSSGLWEAPSFGLPVINIGRRQDGRVRGPNVLDAELDAGSIRQALAKARDPGFRVSLANGINPYVREDTLDLILAQLRSGKSREELLAKLFVDPLETAVRKA